MVGQYQSIQMERMLLLVQGVMMVLVAMVTAAQYIFLQDLVQLGHSNKKFNIQIQFIMINLGHQYQ